MEAKSSTEPGVLKENPKINQPILPVLCDSFLSHGGNGIFGSRRLAGFAFTTMGLVRRKSREVAYSVGETRKEAASW